MTKGEGCGRARILAVWMVLGLACAAVRAPSKRMADGRQWTARHLDIDITPSYCYDDKELNCRKYGRLYTWDSAQRACRSLGEGWRLPTDEEWRQLARRYGGVSNDAVGKGLAAYKALAAGGSAHFEAVLGGGRGDDGKYARLEAHGFYWSASESDGADGWYYNFAAGGSGAFLWRRLGHHLTHVLLGS